MTTTTTLLFSRQKLYDKGWYLGPQHGWFRDPDWEDGFAALPWPASFKHNLAAWFNYTKNHAPPGLAGGTNDPRGIVFGEDPTEDTALGRWLDTMSYSDYIRDVMKLDPEAVARYADPYLAISLGGSLDTISAYGARMLNMPGVSAATWRKEPKDSGYTFPMGNAIYPRLMVRAMLPKVYEDGSIPTLMFAGRARLEELDRPESPIRIRLSSTVVRVEHEGSPGQAESVSIIYERAGKLHRVRARGVVMASGSWINRRIVKGMPEELQSALNGFHHAPVLVANVAVRHWRYLDKLGISAARWFDGFGFTTCVRRPLRIDGRGEVPFAGQADAYSRSTFRSCAVVSRCRCRPFWRGRDCSTRRSPASSSRSAGRCRRCSALTASMRSATSVRSCSTAGATRSACRSRGFITTSPASRRRAYPGAQGFRPHRLRILGAHGTPVVGRSVQRGESRRSAGDLKSMHSSSRAGSLSSRLGLTRPIMQAPIGSLASVELAAAVSNAGGMGSLALTWTSPDAAARLIGATRRLTQKPFFANFVLAFPPHALNAALEAGVPVVTFSWGLPGPLVALVHSFGALVGVQVGSPQGARRAMDEGSDFLICQGVEAGGHVQSSTPLKELLPTVVAVAGNVPVVAAGGLADGNDIAQVISLGACGAMLGTRFVASHESRAHPQYKQAIVDATRRSHRLDGLLRARLAICRTQSTSQLDIHGVGDRRVSASRTASRRGGRDRNERSRRAAPEIQRHTAERRNAGKCPGGLPLCGKWSRQDQRNPVRRFAYG